MENDESNDACKNEKKKFKKLIQSISCETIESKMKLWSVCTSYFESYSEKHLGRRVNVDIWDKSYRRDNLMMLKRSLIIIMAKACEEDYFLLKETGTKGDVGEKMFQRLLDFIHEDNQERK